MNLISKLEKEVEILQSELKSARKFEFAMMRLMQGLAATDEGKIPFSTIGFLFELQTLAKRRDMKKYVQLKSSIQNAKYSSIVPIIDPISHLDNEILAHSKMFLQSEELDDGVIKEHVEQQMKFVDAGAATPTMLASNLGPSYDSDKDSTASLASFLSRPVLINQYTWAENNDTLFKTSFNPWSLYFNYPIIRKKLDNFARLQCKLHLKFVLNSSPFYYGNLRAVYFPLADGRDNFVAPADQITFSQPPGVYMNPANMTSVEMTLPFLWPGNWLRVPEFDEFANMGIIEYVQYAKLRSANGVSGSGITISCYAWAEDVVLAGPTASLALQSDEYDEGPKISGMATTVASVASKLTDVPFIGDMARATEIGASALGGVARLFGYSNPPVIEDVAGFHTKAFHAMANTDTSMPQDKLCLDPKNEITIDNSVTGIDNEDPLAINHLATREAFLTGTNYNGAQNPGVILFTAHVTPHLFSRTTTTTPPVLNQTRINYTPAGWISRMFRQWRGSMVYKFVFVKSKYHTGRVAITWDPERLLDATVDTETTCFTRIVDLQYENEVEIVIPYKAKLPWLTCQYGTTPTWSPSNVPALAYFANSFNGTIRMTVLNKLTGPATSPEIDVLCYAYAGDDIMFSVPTSLDNKTSFFPVQSQEINDDDVAGLQNLEIDKFVTAITVGESVASLRPLLHRSNYWRTQQVGYVNGSGALASYYNFNRNYLPRIPGGPGFDPNGLEWATKFNSAGNVPYSFVNNTHFNWIINAFVGFRGSVNHTYNIDKYHKNTAPIQHFSVERYYGSVISRANGQNRNRNSYSILDAPSTQQSSLSRTIVSNGQDMVPLGSVGMSLTNTYTQSALIVNIPQYSQWRFTPSYEPNRFRYPDGVETINDNVALYSRNKVDNLGPEYPLQPIVDVYVSAGVDFSPVFFVCVPVMFEYSGYPVAVNTDIP